MYLFFSGFGVVLKFRQGLNKSARVPHNPKDVLTMAAEEKRAQDNEKRKILSPGTWFMLSFILWSVIIVPLSIGVFYILKISKNVFDLEIQYSVVFGLIFGLIASAIVGYIYAGKARKQAE